MTNHPFRVRRPDIRRFLVLSLSSWVVVGVSGCSDPEIYLRTPCAGCDAALYIEEWDVFPQGPDVFGSMQQATMCLPNNDGVIDGSEMPVVIGAVVSLRANPPGVHQVVVPAGRQEGNRWVWDFSAVDDGEVTTRIKVHAIEGTWFAPHFPDATNAAAVSVHEPDVLGIYRAGEGEVALLGLASAQADPPGGRTLLVYDQPLMLFRFPLYPGKTWSQTVTFRDALLKGVKNAGREEYLFAVDGAGEVRLPQFSVANALRFRMRVRQTFVVGHGESSVQSIYYLWLSECLGEVARMVSLPHETDPNFGLAREVRRMGL